MRLRALRDLLLEDRITPAKYADIAGPRFQVESGDLTPAGPNHYTTGDPLLVGFTPSTGSPLAPLFRIDNGGELIARKDKFGKDDVQIRMVQGIVATVDTAHQTIFRGDYTWLGNTLQGTTFAGAVFAPDIDFATVSQSDPSSYFAVWMNVFGLTRGWKRGFDGSDTFLDGDDVSQIKADIEQNTSGYFYSAQATVPATDDATAISFDADWTTSVSDLRATVIDGRTNRMIHDFHAFDPRFTGGVQVAVGDVDADSYSEVIAAAGAGGDSEVAIQKTKDCPGCQPEAEQKAGSSTVVKFR